MILGTDNIGNIYWWKDGAHVVHQYMKVHTGIVMLFGHGAALSVSLKQRINTMSFIETETVEISDGIPKNMWVLYFTRAQGKKVKDNLLNENNTSNISLAKNGKISSGKMTKHIKIRFFCDRQDQTSRVYYHSLSNKGNDSRLFHQSFTRFIVPMF